MHNVDAASAVSSLSWSSLLIGNSTSEAHIPWNVSALCRTEVLDSCKKVINHTRVGLARQAKPMTISRNPMAKGSFIMLHILAINANKI